MESAWSNSGDAVMAALLKKDTKMVLSSAPSFKVVLQAGSLSSILEAATASSNKNGDKIVAIATSAATAVTVSSTCTSVTDGGSAAASEDDRPCPTSQQKLSKSSSRNRQVAVMTSPTTARYHGRTAQDRLMRSRERNRVHARKTRQRKKEQMQSLQNKAEHLKKEQIQLKMAINEKNTANILCALFAKDNANSAGEDPHIEALLRRPTDDIPDATKLPALQPLILPSGAAHLKKNSTLAGASISTTDEPDDGIDYELLGKDRTKCTPAELDRIRRERNRMHAKRTRDRKRHFMEEMTDMCKTLENENMLLRQHLVSLNGGVLPEQQQYHQLQEPLVTISPSLPPASPPNAPTGFREIKRVKRSFDDVGSADVEKPTWEKSKAPTNFGQLDTLLQAAGASVRTYHPYSSGSSSSEEEGPKARPLAFKRQRKISASYDDAISQSVATTAASSMTSIGV